MNRISHLFSPVKRLLREQLTQGANPKSLALACAMAYAIGTFPIIGTSTTLCLIFGYAFKVNQPVMQAVNYAVYPLQILLIPVYIRLGEHLTGAAPVPFVPSKFLHLLKSNWHLFLARYGVAALHACLAWALVTPILGFLIFLFARFLFARTANQFPTR